MFVRSLEYEFIADQLHYFESQNQHHMFVHAVNKSSVVQQQGFGFSEKAEKAGQKGRGGVFYTRKTQGVKEEELRWRQAGSIPLKSVTYGAFLNGF